MVRETIEQFNSLQKLDSRIFEIETTLAKIPEMLKASLTRFEKVETEKSTAVASFESRKEELLKTEASISEQKNLLESAQKKLTSVQNNKEYEAALRELDVLKKQITDSEEKIKKLSEEVKSLEAEISSKTDEAASTGNAYKTEKAEKEDENKALFEELDTLKKEREKFAEGVKKSLLSKYERVRSARNNIAIAPISNETCTGCNMKIPPQLAVEVKKESDLIQCPHCQRFLYHQKEMVAAEAS